MTKSFLTKLYQLSRSIHRMLLFVTLALFIVMGITGMSMKYGWFQIIADQLTMRYVHNTLSTWFSISLLGMAITGIVMYIYPILIKKLTSTSTVQTL